MNISLSVAIKNSIILALVILIAHFLLKTPKYDVAVVEEAHQGPALKEVEDEAVNNNDLYSYVYGGSKQGGAGIQVPSPSPGTSCHAVTSIESLPQSPLDGGCGDLMAYEGGALSEQWCAL